LITKHSDLLGEDYIVFIDVRRLYGMAYRIHMTGVIRVAIFGNYFQGKVGFNSWIGPVGDINPRTG
jgi:hypothetical protein